MSGRKSQMELRSHLARISAWISQAVRTTRAACLVGQRRSQHEPLSCNTQLYVTKKKATVSNRRKIRRPPKYMPAVVRSAGALQPGTVTHIEVRHDDDCSIWTHKVCTCLPLVRPIGRHGPYGTQRN